MRGLEWILHPCVQYALMGAGLCLCLYLFFTLKMEISALEQRGKTRETALAESISSIRASLDGALDSRGAGSNRDAGTAGSDKIGPEPE